MLINYIGKDVKLPDFLIVGALKSGTTSLHYYLKQHPQIFMPKVKELWFYCFMDSPPNHNDERWSKKAVTRIDDYIVHFKDANDGQIIGEACPGYLFHYKDTIKNIKRVYGKRYKDVKIITILRNPAERAWSHFMMARRDGGEPLEDFKKAINNDFSHNYVSLGMYHEQVKAFMDEFPLVKVFLYDELCSDSLKVVKEIFGLIGVDGWFVPNTGTKYNISGDMKSNLVNRLIHRQFPFKDFLKSLVPHGIKVRMKETINAKNMQRREMPEDFKKNLIEVYYRNDIYKLQGLIKRDLSSWLKAG